MDVVKAMDIKVVVVEVRARAEVEDGVAEVVAILAVVISSLEVVATGETMGPKEVPNLKPTKLSLKLVFSFFKTDIHALNRKCDHCYQYCDTN